MVARTVAASVALPGIAEVPVSLDSARTQPLTPVSARSLATVIDAAAAMAAARATARAVVASTRGKGDPFSPPPRLMLPLPAASTVEILPAVPPPAREVLPAPTVELLPVTEAESPRQPSLREAELATLRKTVAVRDAQIQELEKALSVGARSAQSLTRTVSTASLGTGLPGSWSWAPDPRFHHNRPTSISPVSINSTVTTAPTPVVAGAIAAALSGKVSSAPIMVGQPLGEGSGALTPVTLPGSARDRTTSPLSARSLIARSQQGTAWSRSMSPALPGVDAMFNRRGARMKEVLRTSPPRRTADGALLVSRVSDMPMVSAGRRQASPVRRLERRRAPSRSLSPPGLRKLPGLGSCTSTSTRPDIAALRASAWEHTLRTSHLVSESQ